MREQALYFISDGEHVKIGIAFDPVKRLAGLQTGSPRQLSLVGSWDMGEGVSAGSVERRLHSRLSHCKVGGEWFAVSEEELAGQFELAYKEAYGAQTVKISNDAPKPKIGRPRTGFNKKEYNRQFTADLRTIKRQGLNMTVKEWREKNERLD